MLHSHTKSAQQTGVIAQTGNLVGTGISMDGILVLQSAHEPSQFIEIALTGTEGFVLGRSDAKSSYMVDVDLSGLGALDRGVSRRHAALVYYEYKIHLVDLSSVNGSLINGQRLMSETPYILNDGDQVTLGQLVLTIFHREK
jgi:predicted component of type VI protein secretion system